MRILSVCLFPSQVHDIEGLTRYNYTIDANPLFGDRDLVAEYVAAMKKYDIKPGFYYSLGSNYYLGELLMETSFLCAG